MSASSIQFTAWLSMPAASASNASCCPREPAPAKAGGGPEPIGEAEEVRLIDRIENLYHRTLDNLVFQRRDAERPLPAVRFRDVDTPRWLCPVGAPVDAAFEIG
jgi:hypothetical protein